MTSQTWTEETDPDCIDDASAAAMLDGAPWRRLAVIGDSTAIGLGAPYRGYRRLTSFARMADTLAMAVGPINYMNLGTPWATSRQVVEEQKDLMVAFKPDLVMISCGGNDLMAETPDYAAIAANLTELFEAGKSIGAQTMTMTLADAFPDAAMVRFRSSLARLNELVRGIAAEHDAILIDLWHHSVGHRPDVMSNDRIHFNMSGHAVLAAEAVKALAAHIPQQANTA
ncbi:MULTISPECIES: SGNH/GDSL hydrolase family protein [Nocardia]|uniref:SGNH/GDSL hydrolase family protein n=1 Tax=Nocardia salmonicida TaxID=53431 RepID=A0ABZ1NH01_9NOCA|nr:MULTISPECIES: SGNH/GDSL hydrolase family protein [Nocardia]KQY32150.1 hypothetical protein ASD42_21310 [Nocardia sp. Root136]